MILKQVLVLYEVSFFMISKQIYGRSFVMDNGDDDILGVSHCNVNILTPTCQNCSHQALRFSFFI